MVETTLVKHAGSSLDELIRAMIGAMVDAHTTDPKLYELLSTEVPHRAGGTEDFWCVFAECFCWQSHRDRGD